MLGGWLDTRCLDRCTFEVGTLRVVRPLEAAAVSLSLISGERLAEHVSMLV